MAESDNVPSPEQRPGLSPLDAHKLQRQEVERRSRWLTGDIVDGGHADRSMLSQMNENTVANELRLLLPTLTCET